MHDEENSFITKIQKPNKENLSSIDLTHRLVGNFADLPPLGSSWPKGKSLNKKYSDTEWQTSTNPQSDGSWAKPPGRVTTSTSSNPQSEGSWAKPPGRVCNNNTTTKVDAEASFTQLTRSYHSNCLHTIAVYAPSALAGQRPPKRGVKVHFPK